MDLDNKLPYLRIVCNHSSSCNFHCRWCHHEGVYDTGTHSLLTPEQIAVASEQFFRLGVRKIKILGGEPTLREDLADIIHAIRRLDEKADISIVTNGHRLKDKLDEYRAAGLTRVNISLFTMDRDYFEQNIGPSRLLDDVLIGIDRAANLRVLSKINHIYHSRSDLSSVIRLAQEKQVRINLLNEIPVDKGGNYVDIQEIIQVIESFGIHQTLVEEDPFSLPVRLYLLDNGVTVEVKHLTISEQHLFNSCETCDYRAICKEGIFAIRLTPNGMLRPCLVRTDNCFNIFGGDQDALIRYLQEL